MNAKIISIGDELLQGITINTNAAFLAEKLTNIGFKVDKIVDIADLRIPILNELEESAGKYNLVLLTGGLGPTSDDITKNVLCEFFGGELTENSDVLKDVEQFVKLRNRSMNQSNRLQSHVPSSCKVVRNKFGTAPGMIFSKNQTMFVSMPGVPFEMQQMFSNDIINILKVELGIEKKALKIIHLFDIPEAELSEKLTAFEKWLPEQIKLAYLPSPEDMKLKLISTTCNNERIRELMSEAIEKIQNIVGENIWGYDDQNMESIIGLLLKEKNATISTAESCTGGYLAHRITSVSGSSQYFKGSLVAYSNETKANVLGVDAQTIEKYGAVSNHTVEQMAINAIKLLNTDFSIATSGIAGPNGGTDTKPVGTTFIAVASKQNVISKQYYFGSLREINIRRASSMGLFMMIKYLKSL